MQLLPLDSQRTLLVAEVAQAHDGSRDSALSYIDAISDAGAHAVKFQTHIAEAESTRLEPWRRPLGTGDRSRYDYWKRMEWPEEFWTELAAHAQRRSMYFLSSPFSLEAFKMLSRTGVGAWKLASGEINNLELLAAMGRSGAPVLLSTGMSGLEEIDRAVALLKDLDSPFCVMQCTSSYPCPAERIGLNMLSVFRDRYRCPVGLSDHSGTIYPALAAASLGASVVEVHVILDRHSVSPDLESSVTIGELGEIARGLAFIDRMRRSPVDKDVTRLEVEPLRSIFMKSIVARTALPAGTVLEREHLALKKPGIGLGPEYLQDLLGSVLKRPLEADELVRETDLIPPKKS